MFSRQHHGTWPYIPINEENKYSELFTAFSIYELTMELRTVILELIVIVVVNSKVVKVEHSVNEVKDVIDETIEDPDDNFNGVYADCFLHMSFPCVQRKTLMYLKQLNNLSEVSVIGDYVKFGEYFLFIYYWIAEMNWRDKT